MSRGASRMNSRMNSTYTSPMASAQNVAGRRSTKERPPVATTRCSPPKITIDPEQGFDPKMSHVNIYSLTRVILSRITFRMKLD